MTESLREDIRNFAIIAHIDHGKTTLVDAMLAQAGVFRDNQERPDRIMDSFDQERERGITILAKNTAVTYRGVKMNILDTPGHADFGGEVERVMTLADGVLLLVDAAEGPLPQTRFVLMKALAAKLKPIVVINKVDRPDAEPARVLDQIYDLFIDVGVDVDELDFPIIYAIGRDGVAMTKLDDERKNLVPLFEAILKHIPAPPERNDAPLQVLVANTDYDDYVGRIAIGRIVAGTVKNNQRIFMVKQDNTRVSAKIMRLYTFSGLGRQENDSAASGDIVALAGLEEVEIGDTITFDEKTEALPRIIVDPPTLRMMFMVNDSPLSGKDGKYVTSRHLRDRLAKAAKQNVALSISPGPSPEQFEVCGRGELQLAVLVEQMRREGYELQLSKPEVVSRVVDGQKLEPVEELLIDVPEEYIGVLTERLAPRKGQLTKMENPGTGRVRLYFKIPSRGLIGFRSEFLTDTRGTGIMHATVSGWEPWMGGLIRRKTGALVSDRQGKTTPYALFNLQPRGRMFIGAGTEVYEGMIIGEHARENDLDVNAVREKKLTNIRAAGKDENVILSTPKKLTLETAIEFIDDDELAEVTPKSLRLRKKQLKSNMRPKRATKLEDEN